MTAGTSARSVLLEKPPAALFRVLSREDVVARLLVPQEIEEQRRTPCRTPEPMEISDEEHPVDDNKCFEKLFAAVQNDAEGLIFYSSFWSLH